MPQWVKHVPPRSRRGEEAYYYTCECGWEGRACELQISRRHFLDLQGVLSSHLRGRPGEYRCKVYNCHKVSDLYGFVNCLDSHRLFRDGVLTVKDAYGRDRVYKI